MNTNIELKNEISVGEYKAWLTGFLRGKGNQLPDLKDWKAIKKMTDKIVPDVIETTPWQNPSEYAPLSPNWWENQPTCGTTDVNNVDNITISNTASEITCDNTGNISISAGGTISIGHTPCYGGYGGYGGNTPASCTSSYTPPHIAETPAVESNEILNEIRRRSAEDKKSLQGHKFDTSKYNIISTPSGHTAKIIKDFMGVEVDE